MINNISVILTHSKIPEESKVSGRVLGKATGSPADINNQQS